MTKYVLNNIVLEIPDSSANVMYLNLSGSFDVERSANIYDRGSFIRNVIANPSKFDDYALTLVENNPEMSLVVARKVIFNLINTCADWLPETVLNIGSNLRLFLEERFREIAPAETGFNMEEEDIKVLVNIFVLRLYVEIWESVFDPRDFIIDGSHVKYSEKTVNQIIKGGLLNMMKPL